LLRPTLLGVRLASPQLICRSKRRHAISLMLRYCSVVYNNPMQLNVRFFALYRERAGRSTDTVQLPEEATVADLVREVRRRFPRLAPPGVNIVVAVNTEYASSDKKLRPGDEICLIPPVSGG